jgi:hypothetical protein
MPNNAPDVIFFVGKTIWRGRNFIGIEISSFRRFNYVSDSY